MMTISTYSATHFEPHKARRPSSTIPKFSGSYSVRGDDHSTIVVARRAFLGQFFNIKALPPSVHLALVSQLNPNKWLSVSDTVIDIQGTDLPKFVITRGWKGLEPIDHMVKRAVKIAQKWARGQSEAVIQPFSDGFHTATPLRKGRGWQWVPGNPKAIAVKLNIEESNRLGVTFARAMTAHYPDRIQPPFTVSLILAHSPEDLRNGYQLIARRTDNNQVFDRQEVWVQGHWRKFLDTLMEDIPIFVSQQAQKTY